MSGKIEFSFEQWYMSDLLQAQFHWQNMEKIYQQIGKDRSPGWMWRELSKPFKIT
jgi:hypothetical protein